MNTLNNYNMYLTFKINILKVDQQIGYFRILN